MKKVKIIALISWIISYSFSAIAMEQIERPKACSNRRAAHIRCDRESPCGHCDRKGMKDSCELVVKRKLGPRRDRPKTKTTRHEARPIENTEPQPSGFEYKWFRATFDKYGQHHSKQMDKPKKRKLTKESRKSKPAKRKRAQKNSLEKRRKKSEESVALGDENAKWECSSSVDPDGLDSAGYPETDYMLNRYFINTPNRIVDKASKVTPNGEEKRDGKDPKESNMDLLFALLGRYNSLPPAGDCHTHGI